MYSAPNTWEKSVKLFVVLVVNEQYVSVILWSSLSALVECGYVYSEPFHNTQSANYRPPMSNSEPTFLK